MPIVEMYGDVNVRGHELKNFIVEVSSSDPVSVYGTPGSVVSYEGNLYVATGTAGTDENAGKKLYVKIATGGDTGTISTKVDNVATAIGYDATASSTGFVDNATGLSGRVNALETAVGTPASGNDAATGLFLAVDGKQGTLTAGDGISIGTVDNVANTIYLPAQTNVTAGEYGSATAIPKLTVDARGVVTKTDSVTVYPPTTPGTAGQVWTSQGSGAGTWSTVAATSMTATSDNSSKTEIPSSYAVQTAIADAVSTAYKIKGSATVAQINGTGASGNITSPAVGDVYNITDAGSITNAGKTSFAVAAGDNIVWTGNGANDVGWDKLGATAVVSYPVTDVTVGGTSALSGTVAALGAAAGLGVDTSTLNTTDDTTVPSSKLVSTTVAGKMDKFGTAPTASNMVVVTVANDDDSLSYLPSNSDTGGVKQPVYIHNGVITAFGSSSAVGGATQPIYIDSTGAFAAGTSIGDAGYLGKTVQGSSESVVFSSSSTDASVPTDKAVYTALETKLDKNTAITAGTKCKITYDADGLVTAGADLTASDIPTLTSAKLSDFASAATAAMAPQFVETALNAASGVSVSGNTYTITTTAMPYGVMVLHTDDGVTTQVFVETRVSASSIVLVFGEAITASEFKVSYILKPASS